MKIIVVIAIVALSGCVKQPVAPPAKVSPSERPEPFFVKFSLVTNGMSKAEVIALLGQPKADGDIMRYSDDSEIHHHYELKVYLSDKIVTNTSFRHWMEHPPPRHER